MKLTIERAALLKALAHVQSVVERRNTIPILSNVLITAQKGRLSLAATDMDLAITEQVEATASKTGSTTAPAHTLFEIVRKLPDGGQVELERRRRQEPGHSRRPLALHPAMPAARRFPGHGRGRPAAPLRAAGDRPQGHHRQDPLRHLQRGDALLSERHLFPFRHLERHPGAARRGHRRPSPGPGRSAAAQGRRGDAGRDRAAQDRGRGPQAAGRERRHGRNRAFRHPHPLRRGRRSP